jgi:uncharacterized membrane protein
LDLAHLHLLLNHFPTIGFLIGLGILLLGLLGRSHDLSQAGLIIFLGIALLSVPIYVSGNGAQEAICQATPDSPCSDAPITTTMKSGGAGYTFAPAVTFSGGLCAYPPAATAKVQSGVVTGLQVAYGGFGCAAAPAIVITGGGGSGAAADASLPAQRMLVSKAMIEQHESAAFVALGSMELTGALAWLGLWQLRRNARLSRTTLSLVLLLALVTFGLMINVSNLGGQIRHPEIRDPAANQAPLLSPEEPFARRVGELVEGGWQWVWPACETLHFIGLCLLFGVAAVVDLRMLGVLKGISFRALHRLLPWGILGFGVNLVTGFLFFVADPFQYVHLGNWLGGQNAAFMWKMVFILLAGSNVLYFTVVEGPWRVESGNDAPLTAKLVAASSLFLVVGIMFWGRMLPFLGGSF